MSEFNDGEHSSSVDNGDHKDDTAAQELLCNVAETMAVPDDVQQFGDDQSNRAKHYLSTLAPEHVSTVVSSTARPLVTKM